MSKRFSLTLKVVAVSILVMAGVIISTVLISSPTYANTYPENETAVLKKALLQGLRTCYNASGVMKDEISATVYSGPVSLVNYNAWDVAWSWNHGGYYGEVLIPTKVGHNSGKDSINCAQLFVGKGGDPQGLLALFNKSNPTLENLGYKPKNAEEVNAAETRCLWATYKYPGENSVDVKGETNHVCFKVVDGKVEGANSDLDIQKMGLGDAPKSGPFRIEYSTGTAVNIRVRFYANDQSNDPGLYIDDGEKWDDVVQGFRDILPDAFADTLGDTTYWLSDQKIQTQNLGDGSGAAYATYQMKNGGQLDALRYFLNNQNAGFTSSEVQFNTLDQYILYSSYYNQVMNNENYKGILSRSPDSECTPTPSSDNNVYQVYNGSGYCTISGDVSRVSETFNGFWMVGDSYTSLQSGVSFTDILNTLKHMNYDLVRLEGGTINGMTGGTINNGTTSSGEVSTVDPEDQVSPISVCYATAGVLGWIACPILDVMSRITSSMYGFIEGSLQVDGATVNSGGLYQGWEVFRNFANILFAIAFIVVILAQVTGIGISNYNIKKILPRLVVIVVLVNISFIICQLAVDVSNILGSQLKALFDRFAQGVAPNGTTFNLGTVLAGMTGTAFLTAGAVATFTVLAFTIPLEIWLFPIILAILGCLVSVFFFFIIIGVRQAGIIVLIALAPVAIVCYALPNTKPLFDRWRKLFTALLLVYPICGLLMGGGTFASTILIQAAHDGDQANGFLTIVAMLMTVVPFFMIPSILRNSMAAMGNLGAKISNFGRGISSTAGRAIRNSEPYKNMQRQQQLAYDERAAKKFRSRLDARTRAGKPEKGFMHDYLARGEYTHQASANRARFDDYRAQAGIGSIAPGTAAGNAILDNLKQEQLATETKNMRSAYEGREGFNVDDAEQVGGEYYNQLEALQHDPKNREALTRMRALQDILMESDAGRTQIKQQQLRHALEHRADYDTGGRATTGDSALSLAASHMLSAHQGEIKAKNRGTWSMQQDFKKKQFSNLFNEKGGIVQRKDGAFGISRYETSGLDSYDGSLLTGADADAITGIRNAVETTAAIRDADDGNLEQAPLSLEQLSSATNMAMNAYGKENIDAQPKVADELRSTIIAGSTSESISGANIKALANLAGDLKREGAISDDQRAQLVKTVQGAFSGGHVTDAAHADALNSILAAAGATTIVWNGQRGTRSQSGDSGKIGHSGSSTITTASAGASIDELRRMAGEGK